MTCRTLLAMLAACGAFVGCVGVNDEASTPSSALVDMRTVTDAELIDVERARDKIRLGSECDHIGASRQLVSRTVGMELRAAPGSSFDGEVFWCAWETADGTVAREAAGLGVVSGLPIERGDEVTLVASNQVATTPSGHRVSLSVEPSSADPATESTLVQLLSEDGTVTAFVEVPTWVEGSEAIALELVDSVIAAIR